MPACNAARPKCERCVQNAVSAVSTTHNRGGLPPGHVLELATLLPTLQRRTDPLHRARGLGSRPALRDEASFGRLRAVVDGRDWG